jgi:molecular chaperone GrpE
MPREDSAEPQVRVVDRRWWARAQAGDDVVEPSAALKPTYVEELERRLADLSGELQSVLAEHRRSRDEFEQVKGRIRREVLREVERGKRTVLAELLDVGDNLDRAVAAAGRPEVGTPAEMLLRGVELVRDQFRRKLESLGATKVAALGQRFDATRHEAVSTAPVDDPEMDGVVVAVVKEGYVIGEDLLRPSSVVVGRLALSGETPEPDEQA